jgi:hypothetical protein
MGIFRDHEQRRRTCRALLLGAGLERFWSERDGLLDHARATVASDGAGLEAGERATLLAVWSVWSGERSALRFDELVGLAAAESLFAFVTASLGGPTGIDAWLALREVGGFVTSDAETHAAAARLFDEARASLEEDRDEAMDMSAPGDACALGAVHLADYAMMMGVECVREDKRRRALATQMAAEALGIFATISHRRALGRRLADNALEPDDPDEEPNPC